MSTPVLPAEVLLLVGQNLSPPHLAACSRVSKGWNDVFIPLLWHTFDDTKLFSSMFCYEELQPCREAADVQRLLEKYGRNIRHLTIRWSFTASVLSSDSAVRPELISLVVLSEQIHENLHIPRTQTRTSTGLADQDLNSIMPAAYLPLFQPPLVQLLQEGNGTLEFLGSLMILRLIIKNAGTLQKLHLGDQSRTLQLISKQDDPYHILASLPAVSDLQISSAKMTISGLRQAMPGLRSLRLTSGIQRLMPAGLEPESDEPWIITMRLETPIPFRERCPYLRASPGVQTLRFYCRGNYFERVSVSKLWVNIHDTLAVLPPDERSLFRDVQQYHLKANPWDKERLDLLHSILPAIKSLTIDATVSDELSDNLVELCPLLESIRGLGGNACHPSSIPQSVSLLLASYRQLRCLDMPKSQIHVSQLSHDQPWICQGLEIFRCAFSGVERLSTGKKALYDYLLQRETEAGTNRQSRTEAEKRVVEKHQRIRQTHELVYWQLAQLTELRVLDFGCQNHLLDGVRDSVDLSLECGFEQLAALKKLEMFGFDSRLHCISKPELAWMVEQWPRLKWMRGLHEGEELDTWQVLELRHYMLELKPSVSHGELPLEHM
ncbi:hypothetical protein BGZ82_009107 [Podila clonocystis]|nr:hypothetical protein BGZ82_009107 [Podila clonocystis]